MATHSSVLAWRIPGTGEPGGLPSMGLHRVGHPDREKQCLYRPAYRGLTRVAVTKQDPFCGYTGNLCSERNPGPSLLTFPRHLVMRDYQAGMLAILSTEYI